MPTKLDALYLRRRFLISGLVSAAAFLVVGVIGWGTLNTIISANSYQRAISGLIFATYEVAAEVREYELGQLEWHEEHRQILANAMFRMALDYDALRANDPDGVRDTFASSETGPDAEGYDEAHLDEVVALILQEYRFDEAHRPQLIGPMPAYLADAWDSNGAGSVGLEESMGNLLLLAYEILSEPEASGFVNLDGARVNDFAEARRNAVMAAESLEDQLAEHTLALLQLAWPVILLTVAIVLCTLVGIWLIILRPMGKVMLHVQDALVAERDRAIASERAKGDFLAVVSHEIRTPMNAVLGFAELLKRSELNKRQASYVDIIHSSGSALVNILNDILDYSKLDAGKFYLAEEAFDLSAVVESAAHLFSPKAREAGLDLLVYVDPRLPESVLGDEGALRHVLFNFVSNAIKFTQEGIISIEVSLRNRSSGPYMQLVVADTGAGIPRDRLENIFEPFVQIEPSNARKHGGTGLGLSISARLIELMGGSVRANSARGKGTKIICTVPLKEPSPPAPPILDVSGIDLTSQRLLYLDPVSERRLLVRKALEAYGACVETAMHLSEVQDALRAAQVEGAPFDLVICQSTTRAPHTGASHQDASAICERHGIPCLMIVEDSESDQDLPRSRTCRVMAQTNRLIDLAREVMTTLHLAEEGCGQDQDGESGGAVSETHAPRKQSILVAEDDLPSRQLLTAWLAGLGFRVTAVEDGEEAVQVAARRSFDLILMDIKMPNISGIDATIIIRRPGGRNMMTPIIGVSANAFAEDQKAMDEAGASDFLPKPVNLPLLLEKISRWVGDEQAADASPAEQPPAQAGARRSV